MGRWVSVKAPGSRAQNPGKAAAWNKGQQDSCALGWDQLSLGVPFLT